ncbi:hypothetical protein R0I52_02840 [Psychrobacter sp. CAM01]|uniref:hypothetical protein n=1 Tax=Psychrobacter sp. CAM01 TaxID=3080335 RepID=UPI0029359116|nr:hypothetical protein [Psychrobacter sp. CAM01]MDV2859642.1 hypothetical protein [Psychrobacter sp. CAM01]
MSIIDQLEQTVTPAVLGEQASHQSVAYVSLLEQFYAVLAARLAQPDIYSELLRSDEIIRADAAVERPFFTQLWPDSAVKQEMIQALAADHHIDETATKQLLINAAPLVYRELMILANGQFLPAFLQQQMSELRPYLPIWSAPIITAAMATASIGRPPKPDAAAPSVSSTAETSGGLTDPETAAEAATVTHAPINPNDTDDSNARAYGTHGSEGHFNKAGSAIHANPAAHHLAKNTSLKQERVRSRNQCRDLLVRVFLLLLAVAALGLALWAFVLKPNSAPPAEPVVTEPVSVPPAPEPVAASTPVEVIVGVDDSGNLYTCSAIVGDTALQNTLQQALRSSFGEQATICQFTVQEGVANSIANLPAELLPNMLTMLRSTPFARLHLQNDRLTLEAPDTMLLQHLLSEMRALAPAMVIDSTAPIPLPDNPSAANSELGDADSLSNDAYPNDQYLNNATGTGEYQATDDETGDSVMPAPNKDASIPADMPNTAPNDLPNNMPSNDNQARPSGPISLSEVDEMASSIIVAEPAKVR